MSDTSPLGFGKYVPGFEFLQNLAKGASNSIPQLPNLSHWVAPTISVEELEKRIEELKAVQFWLEQNSRALAATIQALEVQKMTLATLEGMNFNMGDVANALKLKAAESVQTGVQRVTERAASTAKTLTDAATGSGKGEGAKKGKATNVGALVDPLQLWGSLTQQFQQIATNAMKEATAKTAVDVTKNMATGLAKEAVKSATGAAKRAPAKRSPPRKASAAKRNTG